MTTQLSDEVWTVQHDRWCQAIADAVVKLEIGEPHKGVMFTGFGDLNFTIPVIHVSSDFIDYGGRIAYSSAGDPNNLHRHSIGLPEFAEWFAQKVRMIEAVKTVLIEQTHQGHRIWTILDREPRDNGLKDRIYDIEGQALGRYPNVQVDFKLVNLAEFANPESLHLPVNGKVVYQRN